MISVLYEIVEKTKEGSEEADAVLNYFMGNICKAENGFGNSYIARMIQENESALEESGCVFQIIRESNESLFKNLADIFAKVEKVHKLASQIDKIAFQSKILGLNAAIEAARAGEHGAGFSVVADEVKRLADLSAHTASEISQIIKASASTMAGLREEIKEQVHSGTVRMDNTEKSLKQTFDRFRESLREISDAIRVLNRNYHVMSGDIEKAAVSLQFEDVITQEIDTLKSSVLAFEGKFDIGEYDDINRLNSGFRKEIPDISSDTDEDDVEFFLTSLSSETEEDHDL